MQPGERRLEVLENSGKPGQQSISVGPRAPGCIFLAGRQYFKATSELDPIGAGKHPGQEGSSHGGDLFLDRAGDVKAVTLLVIDPCGKGKK